MDLAVRLAGKDDFNEVTKLLADNNLPTENLKENTVVLFVALIDNKIVASIGLEKYNPIGLLRSLAVSDGFKNQKFGDRLVKQLFDYCSSENIEELYLLTTTAERYFSKYGFIEIDRGKVPEAIKQTQEFEGICPASATMMFKKL